MLVITQLFGSIFNLFTVAVRVGNDKIAIPGQLLRQTLQMLQGAGGYPLGKNMCVYIEYAHGLTASLKGAASHPPYQVAHSAIMRMTSSLLQSLVMLSSAETRPW